MSALRMLLSSSTHDTHDTSSSLCSGDPYAILADEVGHHGDDGGHHDSGEAFNHLYFVMLFIASLWFAGKLFIRFGMPALVGEIVFGIILGPHLINLPGDEGSNFLIIIGEVGLVMLVVEAGIDVDVGMLKLIGPRGVAIACFGSVVPMAFGFCLSYLTMGTDIMTSIAIGACFAPTSMGIALNVLKKAKLLNTPTGQLIIASAILDDVIALIILSELQALGDPSVGAILLPLIVSPILILIIGYLAIKWIPLWIKILMTKVPTDYRENVILALLFAATFIFVPMCHFLGSSHLLGAFLAGLCFCTDHTIHHVWHHQIKRVLQWMLRVFFAATIGFAIPIRDFGNGTVIARGLVYCICGIGKVVTGFFARPLVAKEFCIVGFSMSAWGEFAFILATASFAEGTIDQESFSAVLLAVLLSVIISPYALSFSISYYEKKAQQRMDDNIRQYEDSNLHPVYFAINTKARGQWGHQDKLLHRIFALGFEIVDFRSWHAPEQNWTHSEPLTKESFYVMDTTLALPPTKHLDSVEKNQLLDRVKQVRRDFRAALGEKAVINIKRWLPGVLKSDDQLEPTDDYVKAMFGGDGLKPKHKKTAEYCRTAAFKQAHSIMSTFERKNTLQDLARRSKASLHSMYSMRSMSDEVRRSHMEELGKIVSLTNLFDAVSPSGGKTFGGFPKDNEEPSLTFSTEESPQPGTDKDGNPTTSNRVSKRASKKRVMVDLTGQTGAGGAGAVPVASSVINLLEHFGNEEESEGHKNKHRDESYMSYIYGDEDSEHHKLPEYSQEHLQEQMQFEPKLPELAEENEAKMNDETSDQETDDDNVQKHQSNDTLVSVQTVQSAQTGNSNIDMDLIASEKQNSASSKMTIKIYPPALQAIASRSPASTVDSNDQYMD